MIKKHSTKYEKQSCFHQFIVSIIKVLLDHDIYIHLLILYGENENENDSHCKKYVSKILWCINEQRKIFFYDNIGSIKFGKSHIRFP